ncbi:methyl-accepting chemotaxis sensory transducer [Pseudodesulfovibrio mercurii]|uniref:Methyl-accepting chemotaxis sensory transducer n=1 Tax=Pseudodesulfovibrio mercurii TaxID=641491 RepID=F0JI14_9BACT|nr:HAMP domain-containing methyl-accepting chemotaxis protein [Pseudodesulfovibrio mercurii]EGB14144.1 methyl-accepting chemotaxis sensory transducer [Pseudodesulfovibrio mercurii]
MSIKSKLILIFVSVLLGLGGIFTVNFVGGKYVVRTRRLATLANDGTALFLQARRQEKNFLLRKDEQCTRLALADADKAGQVLGEIARIEPALTARCREAQDILKRYRTALVRVNDLYVAMGLTMKDGLRWEFIQAARNMEAEFAKRELSPAFVIKLLQMRRHEKNYIIRGDEQYVGRVASGASELRAMLADAYTPEEAAGQLKALQGYLDAFNNYVASEKRIAAITAGLIEAARALEPVYAGIAQSSAEKSRDEARLIDYCVIGVELAVGVSILLLLLWIMRSINRPLRRLNIYAGAVAGGDLDAQPEGDFTAELGELRDVLVNMVANLRAVIGEARTKGEDARVQAEAAGRARDEALDRQEHVQALITRMAEAAGRADEVARKLASVSHDLEGRTGKIAGSAVTQQERMSESAAAMEEMHATVNEVALNVGDASDMAGEASTEASQGILVVQRAERAMSEVAGTVSVLEEGMTRLGADTESIGQVIGVINEIADQTNLLALNAAIEAARAGDAGRGFAVVADEVRKLAEKTMVATTEVEERITAIQAATGRNIRDVQETLSHVAEANGEVGNSVGAFRKIQEFSANVADRIEGIAIAARQQSVATEQMSGAVLDVSRLVSTTAEEVQESASAIAGLAAMAQTLQTIIGTLGGDGPSGGDGAAGRQSGPVQ